MDFNKLKQIGLCENKPTKRFEELVQGVQYKVQKLKPVKTQYGDSIVAVTENFEIFLPERFRKEMTNDHIELFNQDCNNSNVVMIYRGQKDFGDGKVTALVEWQKL